MKPKDNIIVQKCHMSCTFFKLMEKEGKGSCTIWLDETPTICDLYVNESDRYQGLATDMLKMCEDFVKAEGYPGVWLYTEEGSWLVVTGKRTDSHESVDVQRVVAMKPKEREKTWTITKRRSQELSDYCGQYQTTEK